MGTLSEKARMRRSRSVALVLVCVGLIVSVGLAVVFHNPLRTLLSFRKVDRFPLYTMRYYGDYGLEDYLRREVPGNSRSPLYGDGETVEELACTCFAALGDGESMVFGRNFDWDTRAALLLFTDPSHGYASVSMIDITYFGFGKVEPPWIDRVKLLDVPYWPFDGLNERGLVVGMMAVPHAQPSEDPEKLTVGSLEAIRLMLDYAEDVDQAISLLREYNISFEAGPPVHYLIADSGGDSAVVEFTDGRMSVLRSDEPWHVSTNFLISGVTPESAKSSCWRYRRAYEALERAGGRVSQDGAMAILESVSQRNTKWSIVYSAPAGDVRVALGGVYDEVRAFRLDQMGR